MVVLAIALLDDLDKEIHLNDMRVKVHIHQSGSRSSVLVMALGKVWVAFPRDGKNSVRQSGICQSRETNGHQVIVASALHLLAVARA